MTHQTDDHDHDYFECDCGWCGERCQLTSAGECPRCYAIPKGSEAEQPGIRLNQEGTMKEVAKFAWDTEGVGKDKFEVGLSNLLEEGWSVISVETFGGSHHVYAVRERSEPSMPANQWSVIAIDDATNEITCECYVADSAVAAIVAFAREHPGPGVLVIGAVPGKFTEMVPAIDAAPRAYGANDRKLYSVYTTDIISENTEDSCQDG